MLKNSLYTLGDIQQQSDGEYSVEVSLNEDHEIFRGHFPEQPILPGVCLIEILKDLINAVKKDSFLMHEASMIKYLQMVNPAVNKILTFYFSIVPADTGLKITASSMLADGVPNFKFKGHFIPAKV